MSSSGVRADSVDTFMECSRCEFTGNVEVFFDPEVRAVTWFCPGCVSDRDEDWDTFWGDE